jgi:hypothetical protein
MKQYTYGYRFIHPPKIENEEWDYSLQLHTNQNGKHFDLRLLRPGEDKAFSWAMKKVPIGGIKPALAMRTHDHGLEHMDFEGDLNTAAGYGKVKLIRRGKIKMKAIDEQGIHFTMEGKDYRLRPFRGKRYMFEQVLY